MRTDLYLDTARLGRMCPTAVRAEQDFAKLVSQLGSSLYFEQFLVAGFSSLPSAYQVDCPGLSFWKGIEGLKQSFAKFVNAPDYSVHLFGHSRALIEAGVNSLFNHTNRVLTTDLEWLPYLDVLTRTAKAANKSVTVCPLRDAWLQSNETHAQLASRISSAYVANQCDGLFLSSISYLGLAVPIREVLDDIPARRRPNFVVVDAAQSFGQKPFNIQQFGDIVIGGAQKWMEAGRPLRVAITRPGIDMNPDGYDPLHCFTQNSMPNPHGETVDPGCLITAAAALSELTPQELVSRWKARRANRQRLQDVFNFRQPNDSAICLIHGKNNLQSRSQLLQRGIVASAFENIVRLSMPTYRLRSADLSRISNIQGGN